MVVVGLIAVLASSGTAAAASYLVLATTNSAGATTTLKTGANGAVLALTNTNSTGGTSARGLAITVPTGRAPLTVNSSAGKATNLNADKLDGRDSKSFGEVRDFAQSTSSVSDVTTLVSFREITLHRQSYIGSGSDTNLRCQLLFSSSANGNWGGFVVGGTSIASEGGLTPLSRYHFGLASQTGAVMGQLVFFNSATMRAVTVQFSIQKYPGNAGCSWQGTVASGVE